MPLRHAWAVLTKKHLLLQANYGAILDAFASVGQSANKNVRSAWASFLVNLSLLLTTEAQADSDGALIAMSAVAELLNSSPKDDSETIFRCVLATLSAPSVGDMVSVTEAFIPSKALPSTTGAHCPDEKFSTKQSASVNQ